MTKREYFELLVKTSEAGGFPSVAMCVSLCGSKLRCLYRGPDGRKCAVGLLIPDDKFDPAINSDAVYDVIDRVDVPEGMSEGDLNDCQKAHDALAREREWPHDDFVALLRELPCFRGL